MHTIEQAIAALQNGNISQAEITCREILQRDGRNFDALHVLGIIHAQRGQFDKAEPLLRTALSIDQTMPVCRHNYGKVLCGLDRYQDGINEFNKALAQAPNQSSIYSDRGNAEMELGFFQDAVRSYEKALSLDSKYAPAHYNRGNVLQKLSRYTEALASYDRALAINPRYAEAICNRGIVLRCMKRFDGAFASFERVLGMYPDFAEAHFAEGELRLLLGDFARGWPKYEWRWKSHSVSSPMPNFVQPLWLGAEAIEGKTLLLHGEQGLGDTIQFCRYVPLVAKRGARIVLEVDTSLKELMSDLSAATTVIAKGEPRPAFHMHCPLASLPLALGTRLDTIPAYERYLSVSRSRAEKWQDRLGRSPSGLRVAVNWAGNPKFRNDLSRSIGLQALSRLFGNRDTQFYSIQKELSADDSERLKNFSNVIHLGAEIDSFSDTAAIISLMDLLVSSDTSVAHLAGAIGAPTWTLLSFAPDWRWLLEREDSPWYPTMRLFRQPEPGNWDSVIATVSDALSSLLAAKQRRSVSDR